MKTDRPAIFALKESGWTPGRRVDISDDMAALATEGIPPFEVLVDFLREYSGLVISVDHAGVSDQIWFSGRRASELMSRAWIEDYSRRTGLRVAPVGAAYREHLTILAAENGTWYGGFDDELGSLGSTFVDALDNLILNAGFVERF